MKNNDNRIVRQSYCKKCNGFVRTMALELVSGEQMISFEKEVEEFDLEVETITLKELKEIDRGFCSCKEEPKQYHLNNIQEIADVVTPENLDHFLEDFRGMLLLYMTAKCAAEAESLPIKSFKWTDDGGKGEEVAKVTLTANGHDDSIEMKLTKSDEDK